jgi:hypothetical protein
MRIRPRSSTKSSSKIGVTDDEELERMAASGQPQPMTGVEEEGGQRPAGRWRAA